MVIFSPLFLFTSPLYSNFCPREIGVERFEIVEIVVGVPTFFPALDDFLDDVEMGVLVMFWGEPDEFVEETTVWTGVVPRFIVARIATSCASGVFDKASLSRGEFVVFCDVPVKVEVVVDVPVAGAADFVQVGFIVQVEMK